MEKKSRLKSGILITVLCIVVFAAAVFILLKIYSGNRVEGQLEQGEKYLNGSDYHEAILAYQQALEIEPANTEAIVGLAQAYNAIGDTDFAMELLDQLGGESKDPAVQELAADLYEESGDIGEAIRIVEDLIEKTDEDKYYEKRDELIAKKLSTGRIYGNSGGHEALIGDKLLTRGLNVSGQLGIARGINQADFVQSRFESAAFPGTAVSVSCFAQNTYVIDDAGNLWMAGTNRSGQEAIGSSTTVAESGWRQLTGIDNVAQVVGSRGYVIALKKDGSLWYAGQNYGHAGGVQLWNPEFTPINAYGTVLQIEHTDTALYILNSQGELYESQHTSDLSYTNRYRIATNVTYFGVNGHQKIWLDGEGRLGGEAPWLIQRIATVMPVRWQNYYDEKTYSDVVITDLKLQAVAANEKVMLLLDMEHHMYVLTVAGLELADDSGMVETVYKEGDYLIAQFEDKRVRCWDVNGAEVTLQ